MHNENEKSTIRDLNDDGLLNQIHHMFDPKSWEIFLKTAQQALEKKRNIAEKTTDFSLNFDINSVVLFVVHY